MREEDRVDLNGERGACDGQSRARARERGDLGDGGHIGVPASEGVTNSGDTIDGDDYLGKSLISVKELKWYRLVHYATRVVVDMGRGGHVDLIASDRQSRGLYHGHLCLVLVHAHKTHEEISGIVIISPIG